MEVKPGYKQTEVGVIPEQWDVKPLSSVLSKGRLGGNYPNQDRETEHPLMKMGNIARGYIDTGKVEYIAPAVRPDPSHRLRCGDVLFNTRNTLDLVGKVAIWRDELPVAYYNSNLMRLEFDPQEVCSNEYANYALNSDGGVARLRALATGTTSVAAIYTRDLVRMPFVKPSPSEQRAIARALNDVDALIDALNRLIAKKRDLKQAAMQQLLTGQKRLPGFDSEWETKRLGDVAETSSGTTPPRAMQDRYYKNAVIAWVKTMDLTNSDLFETSERVTELALKETCLRVYPVGTVLVAMYGGFQQIGRTGLLRIPATVNQAITAIQPKINTLVSEYLLEMLNYRVDYWKSVASSSRKDPNITSQDARNFLVAYPSPPEQTAIAEVLSDMDAELAALEQRRNKTLALKQGMMQELLTGRTRLV